VADWGDGFWQQRANEARLAAEATSHPDLKREWQRLAAEFERLAKRVREKIAARRLRG
jgi:hypothetical protein